MTNQRSTDLALLPLGGGNIPLFMPYITDKVRSAVANQLQTRWVGQGPKVNEFEAKFSEQVLGGKFHGIAVQSGTAALHLAYILALEEYWGVPSSRIDGEVICPVFTCTATNLPWIYEGMKIRWADIDPESMNISVDSIESMINSKTRAISVVHYGGFPAEMQKITELAVKHGIPVIEDAAQALGGVAQGKPIGQISPFTIYSFQAIKHITTGDGGLISIQDHSLAEKAKRLRWFGIDRVGKQGGTWENDISEVGYKYQMTDIAAAMGLAGLEDLGSIEQHRASLLKNYNSGLREVPDVKLLDLNEDQQLHSKNAAWLATIVLPTKDVRDKLREYLRDNGIESNPVHYRNDMYSVFEGHASGDVPNMDNYDSRYLCLPIHMGVSVADVLRICDAIKKFFG